MPDQTPSMPPLPDRELLKLAAMAAGFEGVITEYPSGYVEMGLTNHWKPDGGNCWAPLARDDDALRLAVQLDIQIWRNSGGTVSGVGPASSFWGRLSEPLKPDPYAATRRAIVKAAAEIGARLLPTLSLDPSKATP